MPTAPWHRASFDSFLGRTLPELLASRLPLAGYHVERNGEHACRAFVTLATGEGELALAFDDVPACDEDGLFEIDGRPVVVVPIVSSERLDEAHVACVGEQLHEHVAQRLGEAPADLKWSESLARSWLPLGRWLREALTPGGAEWGAPVAAQYQDAWNWLARITYLRRIIVPNRTEVIAPGQLGLACPIETPEGRNIGRVLTVARGAEIRDGRLAALDDSAIAKLGPAASMIPLLSCDDANRALMGANMMRQWVEPEQREPALVQSGCEPELDELWCGRNLLTAFVSWGVDTYEDGIVVSESAATRLDFPHALEPGDSWRLSSGGSPRPGAPPSSRRRSAAPAAMRSAACSHRPTCRRPEWKRSRSARAAQSSSGPRRWGTFTGARRITWPRTSCTAAPVRTAAR
jgi:hypothetical protein